MAATLEKSQTTAPHTWVSEAGLYKVPARPEVSKGAQEAVSVPASLPQLQQATGLANRREHQTGFEMANKYIRRST